MRNSKNRSGERGVELVEAAFSLLVFLVLVFGLVEFTRAVYAYDFVSGAARQATRWASVRGSNCSHTLSGCQATTTNVQTYVQGLAPGGINTSQITATTTWPQNPPNCPASPSNAPLCDVKVKVSYNFSFVTLSSNIPFLSGLGNFTMSSTSDMIISQ